MHRIRSFILALLVMIGSASPCPAARSFQEVWDDAMPLMSEGADIVASGRDVDERSWGEILTFRDSRFSRLLEECFEVMADSSITEGIREIDAIRRANAEKRARIAELQKKAVSAPSSSWNPLKDTQQSIREDVVRMRQEIADNEARMARLREAAFAALQARGLSISREQVDAMLGAIDGNDTASVMAVAENIKAVQAAIESQLSLPGAGMELVQSYTGVYMMCLKVYVYAIELALQRIDDGYLKRLDDIRREAEGLLAEAKAMMGRVGENDRKILAANIPANQRTLEAVELYRRYLERQKAHLRALLREASTSADVAVNTYRTVRTGAELLGLMKRSEADFSEIFKFQPPSLSLLYDERLKQEFESITERLRAE
ncbi:MAG: hypothetical protein MSH25_06135 [Desulfovibrio sp.]|uniref:hypothetical protein n=1 Tax=Desulfovibrio sp. TaxID=885 RepID=UPI0025C3985C|nr:hypothetical protein [Desulfovibrio sp.]MCI7568940.1 hypothetical protein [Desulfovibrio sp.]